MRKGFLPVGLALLTLFPITDLIHYVGVDHFQCTFDDRTLHPASYTFFGIQWKDCMVFYCLLVGKLLPIFIYLLVKQPTHYS